MRTDEKRILTNKVLLGLMAAAVGFGSMGTAFADAGETPTVPETTTRVKVIDTKTVPVDPKIETDEHATRAQAAEAFAKALSNPEKNNMPMGGHVIRGTASISAILSHVTKTTTTPGTKTITTSVTETLNAAGEVIHTSDPFETISEPVYDSSKATVDYAINDIRGANVMNIQQTTDRAIIQWNSFDAGSNSMVNFIQTKKDGALNPAAMTLNEVTGAKLSTIAGKINSIGTFILTNPNGIYFAEGSEVNAAGIIASTNALDHDRFYDKGEILFNQDDTADNRKNAGIIVNGTLNVATLAQNELDEELTPLGKEIKGILTSSALNSTGLSLGTDIEVLPGVSAGTNTIKIVANGDIAIGANAQLHADRVTNVSSTGGTAGKEGYTTGGSSSDTREGVIVLRADANADDVATYDEDILEAGGVTDTSAIKRYDIASKRSSSEMIPVGEATPDGKLKTAKVYLNNAAPMTANSVSVFFDADITDKGVNGTPLTSIGVANAGQETFTQKDYKQGGAEASRMASHVNVNASQTYNKNGMLEVEADGKTPKESRYRGNHNTNFAMLINDPYQLQAIQDTKEVNDEENYAIKADGEGYYGNLTGSYALGQTLYNNQYKVIGDKSDPTFETINTYKMSEWNGGKGFNPIGTEKHPFKGSFTGNGLMGYGIYDFTINRPEEDYVGLFARTEQNVTTKSADAEKTTDDGTKTDTGATTGDGTKTADEPKEEVRTGGYFGSVTFVDAKVEGKNNVGALAGAAGEGTAMSNITNRKRYVRYTEDFRSVNELFDKETGKEVNVKGLENVGGIVGLMNDARMYDNSHNQGYIVGKTNVGGLAGAATGTATETAENGLRLKNYIRNSYNSGHISPEMSLGTTEEFDYATPASGNLKGYGEVTNNTVDGKDFNQKENFGTGENRGYKVGVVEGETNVGGLVGSMTDGTVN
ncbi:MAG: filamentous hemagglutinin N-terminal domain-containing protein [Selenomonadaceae bacterium]|nr:filamentous hemagglutinin N-terminal domain-containing protein [Selenomonadaceae bacterium]